MPEAKWACPGPSIAVQREGKDTPFVAIERTLVDYFDATLPRGSQAIQEASEWYAEIGGHRIELSSLAMAIAQALEARG